MKKKVAVALAALLLFAVVYASYGAGPYGRGAYGRRTGTTTFALELNINGSQNDTAEVNPSGTGFYRANNITNFVACVEDATIQSTPVFGLVFSGSGFDYINVTTNLSQGNSFRVIMSQNFTRSRFIIPVTKSGCSVLRNRFQDIQAYGYLPSAFVPFAKGKNPLEVSLPLPELDLVGDVSKTGAFKILLEKNETDQIVQIIGTG